MAILGRHMILQPRPTRLLPLADFVQYPGSATLSGAETINAALPAVGVGASLSGVETIGVALPIIGGVTSLLVGVETFAASPGLPGSATLSGVFALNVGTPTAQNPALTPHFAVGSVINGGRKDGSIVAAISQETRLLPVSATLSGLPTNPTGATVNAAVVPRGTTPSTWAAATWETWTTPWGTSLYFARIILGSTGFVVTKGYWDIWIQIVNLGETVEVSSRTPLVVI